MGSVFHHLGPNPEKRTMNSRNSGVCRTRTYWMADQGERKTVSTLKSIMFYFPIMFYLFLYLFFEMCFLHDIIFFSLAAPCSLKDLSSLTRTEPRATAVKSLSPKHWTAGETSKLFTLNLHSIRELVAGFHFQNHWACEYSVILPRDTGPHAGMLCPHLSVWHSKAPTQTRGLLYPSQRLG